MIIADPRVPKDKQGKVSALPALNIDLPATFVDWAGLVSPERFDGRSLKPIVDGDEPSNWRSDTFHEHFAVRHRIPAYEGIRTPTHKYVRYVDHNTEFLHDLKKDPDELINHANDPKYAEILEKLRKRTNQRVKELGGPLDPPKQEFTASTSPHPEASAAVTLKPDKEGFVYPFNGKNLKGWTGDKKYWSVKEGALTGVTDGSLKKNRFITWNASTIRNFELQVTVKFTDKANSGIQYRSKMLPEIGLDVAGGYQCDIMARENMNGMAYEERGRRILSYTGQKVIVDQKGQPWVIGEMPVKKFPPNVWHEYRISVRGNHHQHWIDGHKTADFIDLDENSRALDGILGFQVHVGPAMQIQFKDIRMKHLPDNLPLRSSVDTKIPPSAYGVRPQGTPKNGWTAPFYRNQN
jgi:hypothetical protein